jgi:hypothetical protein
MNCDVNRHKTNQVKFKTTEEWKKCDLGRDQFCTVTWYQLKNYSQIQKNLNYNKISWNRKIYWSEVHIFSKHDLCNSAYIAVSRYYKYNHNTHTVQCWEINYISLHFLK